MTRWVRLWALVLAAICLWPLAQRFAARREAARLLEETSRLAPSTTSAELSRTALLRLRPIEPARSSWATIGGCGVGGASASGGAFKWVGRGVTGGLIDLQLVVSQSADLVGGRQTSASARAGVHLGEKWTFGLNVPFLFNVEDVEVFGDIKTAELPGFGDVSLEASRRFGDTNASALSLVVGLPTGSFDAVRQGVVLPRRQQLGAGTVTGAVAFEHTFDRDFGPIILGGTGSFGGWENSIGDLRASSLSAYCYTGYILGPFVPSAGLTLTGKLFGDRERGDEVPNQAMFLITPSLGLEWSSDWVALLLSGSIVLAPTGFETWSVGLGIQTSLF